MVHFETYVADRIKGVSDVLAFLGLEPEGHEVRADRIYHESRRRPVLHGRWKRLSHHRLYRRLVRPLLSNALKKQWKHRLLPRLDDVIRQPKMETIDRILSQVSEDNDRLAELLGLEQPLWDLEALRTKYQKKLEPDACAAKSAQVPDAQLA